MSLKFNPFTGSFDWAQNDTKIAKIACEEAVKVVKSIVTTDTNALGNKNFFYDAVACKWVEAGPQISVDSDGEVILSPEDC
jgi:hypothetical protein